MIVGEESQANSSSLTKHKWNIEIILSVLFDGVAAKRTKNGVSGVSRLRARRGLRALDLRRLLKKAGENSYPVGVIRFGKANKIFREYLDISLVLML